MAMDFSTPAGQLQAVHVIDRDYRYRLFTSAFEEMTPLTEKKGASLAALDGEWLAVSDHTRASDQLFFYDIRDGGPAARVRRPRSPARCNSSPPGTGRTPGASGSGVRQTGRRHGAAAGAVLGQAR